MTRTLRIAVFLLLLTACGSDGNERPDRSAGAEWRLTEDLRLGSVEAGVPAGFGDQIAIAVGRLDP